jgi:SAM-dependent methyltransferase
MKMEKSDYAFGELEASGKEGRRLSAQARAFVDLELPELLKKIPARARVADFGCGTGVISAALAMYLPEAEIVGLDPDEKALEFARKEGEGLKNLQFERYGFGRTEAPQSGPFDVAFTRLVLLHLADPGAAIEAMAGSLKAGGLLYLVDCDDDYVNFEPKEAWQGQIIDVMKEAQKQRGGTRVLGSQLLKLVSERGLWPEGCRVLYYSTTELGMERWKEIFVPALGNMAERDLRLLEQKGDHGAAKAAALRQSLKEFFEKPEAQAQLSAWHIWARKA